ncbi:MAG: hypothetical protein AA908_11640 [Chlorobi bacterium NICIL-2]|nr:MAG: hypothetical protein AA908_11640 [Chlorobi bacterium NICIL-2]
MLIYYVGTSDSCLMVRKDGRWVKIVDFVNLAGQETDPVATAKTVSITAGNTAIAVAGGTQTVGNNPNFTLTVPNTNPIWNASQLQGVSISSTSPTTDQLLQYNGTSWAPWTPNYLPSSNISGTTNYVAKFTGVNSLGNSQIFDNGTYVGIGTTTPQANLDVNGNFKLGQQGTVTKNIISFAWNVGNINFNAGTIGRMWGYYYYSADTTVVKVPIPAGSQPTTTQAVVMVSPNTDLPPTVSIAYARLTSTSNVEVVFVNASSSAATAPPPPAKNLTLYITIIEF